MAQAFDLADITTKVGAPSFAFFAKGGHDAADSLAVLNSPYGFAYGCPVPSHFLRRGGYHERLQRRSYATRSRNEIFVQP